MFNLRMTQIDKENMLYFFKDCLEKYPEEILEKAYLHYLKAEKLRPYLKAIEEFQIVKQMIPEKTIEMNSASCGLIHDYNVNKNNKEYYYNLKIQLLNENMEIALKSNNLSDLCNIYNELSGSYCALNNIDKGLEFLKKAVDIAGITSIYGTNLACCYERLGLYDEAISIYKKIKNNNPEFGERYNFNIDFEITRINDKKLGKNKINEEICIDADLESSNQKVPTKKRVNKLAYEHSQKGDEFFNNEDYENAFSEYNAACEIDKKEIIYLIKMLMHKEMYETEYLYEIDIISKALIECERLDKIEYMPFLLTLCGDYMIYDGAGSFQQAEICYELAIDLLDKVPINEKFAAPYYKLARLKEQDQKYGEALTLFQFANIIDKSYDTEKDINRIRLLYQDNGISNSKAVKKLITDMEFSLKSGLYSKVIEIGKNALEYEPNNVKVYYLICKAFECNRKNLDKNQYYEFKWFAREGMMANNINYDKSVERLSFYWFLGICCKYENKIDQAKYYFEYIQDIDETQSKEITKKAVNELYFINYGKPLYEELWEK